MSDINWKNIRKQVNERIGMLEIIDSEIDRDKVPMGEKIRAEVLKPTLVLLARFCECIDVTDTQARPRIVDCPKRSEHRVGEECEHCCYLGEAKA